MDERKRRWSRILLGGSVVALVACATSHEEVTRREPSSAREYRVLLKRGHATQRPAAALFLLHAYSVQPDDMVRNFRLIQRAVRDRDWLLVVPQGELDASGRLAWNASAACCGDGEAARRRDDLGYLRGVLADLRAQFAVDSGRVYAFGVSNGSFMAQRWACSPNAGLRAVVSVAGAAPGPDDPPCAASDPISILHVHGTSDEVIPYAGSRAEGARHPAARDTIALWRTLAGAGEHAAEIWWRTPFLERVHEERWQGERARIRLWSIESSKHHLPFIRFETETFLAFLQGA